MHVEEYFDGPEGVCRVCGHRVYLDGRDLEALAREVAEREAAAVAAHSRWGHERMPRMAGVEA